MKTWRNYITLGLMALFVGAGALLWHWRAETAAEKDRAAQAVREPAPRTAEQSVRDPAAAKPPKDPSQAAAPDAPVKISARQNEALGEAMKSAIEDGIKADLVKQWLADANDPAVMRRLNTQARNQTLRRYSALFTQMNLPADETEAFTKLLADKRQAPLDLVVGSLQQGADPTDDMDKFRSQINASRAEIETQIHALLGDAGYAQYQTYDQNFSHANVITNLQTALLGTEPLTSEQTARLNEVMQKTQASHVTEEVIAGAKEFLSPAQLQALQDLRALTLANAQKRLQATQILPTGATPGGKP